MDKAASIFLRADIHPDDLRAMAHWLRSRRVTRYLNEDVSAPEQLEQLLFSTPVPLLTCRMNQHGRFFLVCRDWDVPIGFVKLTEQGAGVHEIVFAIGDESLWGLGYGSRAVRAALDTAFLSLRARKLVARIYHGNQRSVNTVLGCGFSLEKRGRGLDAYSISMADYLEMMSAPEQDVRKPSGSLA